MMGADARRSRLRAEQKPQLSAFFWTPGEPPSSYKRPKIHRITKSQTCSAQPSHCSLLQWLGLRSPCSKKSPPFPTSALSAARYSPPARSAASELNHATAWPDHSSARTAVALLFRKEISLPLPNINPSAPSARPVSPAGFAGRELALKQNWKQQQQLQISKQREKIGGCGQRAGGLETGPALCMAMAPAGCVLHWGMNTTGCKFPPCLGRQF